MIHSNAGFLQINEKVANHYRSYPEQKSSQCLYKLVMHCEILRVFKGE